MAEAGHHQVAAVAVAAAAVHTEEGTARKEVLGHPVVEEAFDVHIGEDIDRMEATALPVPVAVHSSEVELVHLVHHEVHVHQIHPRVFWEVSVVVAAAADVAVAVVEVV